jgi:hypothetical protein
MVPLDLGKRDRETDVSPAAADAVSLITAEWVPAEYVCPVLCHNNNKSLLTPVANTSCVPRVSSSTSEGDTQRGPHVHSR